MSCCRQPSIFIISLYFHILKCSDYAPRISISRFIAKRLVTAHYRTLTSYLLLLLFNTARTWPDIILEPPLVHIRTVPGNGFKDGTRGQSSPERHYEGLAYTMPCQTELARCTICQGGFLAVELTVHTRCNHFSLFQCLYEKINQTRTSAVQCTKCSTVLEFPLDQAGEQIKQGLTGPTYDLDDSGVLQGLERYTNWVSLEQIDDITQGRVLHRRPRV